MSNETLSFEKAFERLEQILETMNAGKTPLEESLKLFEEAEKLIRTCTGRLNSAEQKIETLIKSRNGEVALDTEQKPRVEMYSRPPASTMQSPEPEQKIYARPPAPAMQTPEPEQKTYSRPQSAPAETYSRPPAAPSQPSSKQMDELPF